MGYRRGDAGGGMPEEERFSPFSYNEYIFGFGEKNGMPYFVHVGWLSRQK